jgi:putative flavoprotein involved in K+ transport
MDNLLDSIVIGAGQAGLAAGYHLQRAGLGFQILERASETGGSWPSYYDSLTLFSPARYSSLPGLPFPGDPEHYPRRDEVIAYLQSYAAHFRLPVLTDTGVTRITRQDGVFQIETDTGRRFAARSLIAATGSFNHPYIPHVPGRERFGGQMLHSKEYRSAEPFQGKRIVVVGAGNSAIQIAVELARTAQVTLATRAPVRFLAQRLLGKDIHFWLRLSGLDHIRGLDRMAARVLDTGIYRRAIALGQPERRPMFVAMTEAGVRWADGVQEAVDAVIFATGYRPSLPYLAELGALDDDGSMAHRRGISRTVPGLYTVGQSGQRNFASATLRGVGTDAAIVVRHLQGYLRRVPKTGNRMRPFLEQPDSSR